MLKIKTFVLVAVLSLGFVAGAVAQDLKIGFVNTQRIFRDAPEAKRIASKLEAEFSRRDQELQRIAKQLQGMQEKLEKDGVTMSESERRKQEREFSELSRDFQRKQREFREDLNLRQNEENSTIIDKANKAIRKIAEAEKYDLIVQEVVWVNPRLDITDKVIKALSEGK